MNSELDTLFKVSVVCALVWMSVKLNAIHEAAQASRGNAGGAIEQARRATVAAEEARDMCND